LDQAGNDVIAKIQQAAGMAEQHAQRVLGIAHQTSMQLRVAEDRIAQLETDIRTYKDRAERAEEWLRRIEHEIEKTFNSPQPQEQQKVEDNVARFAKSRR
jgi:DNA repair ATPase RecN